MEQDSIVRLEHLLQKESQLNSKFPHIQQDHLEILIHWIYQVAEVNHLQTKTIELSVLYIKCYLSNFEIHTDYLQLLAVSALLVAVKFNECQSIIRLAIDDCVLLCQSKYKVSQIQNMENCILELIGYNANQTTISDYFEDEDQYSDLVLFVTMETTFLHCRKYDLAMAIMNFTKQDTQLNYDIQGVIDHIKLKLSENVCDANTKPTSPPKKQKHMKKVFKKYCTNKGGNIQTC